MHTECNSLQIKIRNVKPREQECRPNIDYVETLKSKNKVKLKYHHRHRRHKNNPTHVIYSVNKTWLNF